MTLQNGPHEHLHEARKEAAKGCSWSRQDQHHLPSQILHLLHPNSRIHISWIKHIYRKKGINTCTHPARAQDSGKGQILLLHIEQAPKDAVRSKTPKNPHWSKHSARSEHLCSLPVHPPCTWELIPNPWRHRQEFPLNFITENKSQFPKSQQMASSLWQWVHNKSLTLHTRAPEDCGINWVKSWLWWSRWQNSHWLQAGLGSYPLYFWMSGQQPSTRSHSSLPSLSGATCQGSVTTPEHQSIPQQAHKMLVSPGEVSRMENSP